METIISDTVLSIVMIVYLGFMGWLFFKWMK